MQLLCIVFLHLSIQSCTSEDDLNSNSAKELSLTDSKQKVFPFIYLENNRYVMKLSEQEMKKMDISDLNCKLITQSLERTNQRIEELENDPATNELTLYDPQTVTTKNSSGNATKYGTEYIFGGLQYSVKSNNSSPRYLPDRIIEKIEAYDFVDREIYLDPPLSREYDILEIRMKSNISAAGYYIRFHIDVMDNLIEHYILGGHFTFSNTYNLYQFSIPETYPDYPYIREPIKPLEWTNQEGTFDRFYIRYQIENQTNWQIGFIQFRFKCNLE